MYIFLSQIALISLQAYIMFSLRAPLNNKELLWCKWIKRIVYVLNFILCYKSIKTSDGYFLFKILWSILTIFIFLLLFKIKKYEVQNYNVSLVQNSKELRQLFKIKNYYENKCNKTNMTYCENVNLKSLEAFKKYDYQKKAIEIIHNNSWINLKMLQISESNKELIRAFESDKNKILSTFDTSYYEDHFVYGYCEEIKTEIPTLKIVINICYNSPAGRNRYNDSFTFSSLEQFQQLFEIIRKEDEYKKTKEYQRSLMTKSLRYDVMKRDGFKCVICGASQAEGAKLHVDHILPVSKGGKTTMDNLRTLCQDCNLGKSDKFDWFDLN